MFLPGAIRRLVGALRRDVHCFRDSLSVQDLERVGGASGRAVGDGGEFSERVEFGGSGSGEGGGTYMVCGGRCLGGRNSLGLVVPFQFRADSPRAWFASR